MFRRTGLQSIQVSDKGWDKVREETFARQKELGVIPPECELTLPPKDIPA